MGKSHKDNKSVSRSKRQFKRRFAEIEHDLESDVVGEELDDFLTDDDEDGVNPIARQAAGQAAMA